jgi:hypothetical protein
MPCPCRAQTIPLCKRLLKATAGARLGMRELTSAVCRRSVGDTIRFGFFRLPRGVLRLAIQNFPATRGLSQRTRHCRRKAEVQHGMCDFARRDMAGARHGMCKLPFNIPCCIFLKPQILEYSVHFRCSNQTLFAYSLQTRL